MALLFAVAAGTMSASYAICLRLAAGAISPALGALIISGAALSSPSLCSSRRG